MPAAWLALRRTNGPGDRPTGGDPGQDLPGNGPERRCLYRRRGLRSQVWRIPWKRPRRRRRAISGSRTKGARNFIRPATASRMKQMRAMITRILDRDMNNLQTKFATSYPEFDPRRELHSQSRCREMAVAAVPSACYPDAVRFVRLPT